ncbi:GNAT family N-acetyltransferase [Sporolactobacillus shoreicorticis]|nr:GNAT family N-acetyltransferase [Sporolactobacillus shoreicorticis]
MGIFLRSSMQLIGVLDYMEQTDNKKRSIGLIMIHKEFQKHGFDLEIIKAFLEWCRRQEFFNIQVAVLENNPLALKFWSHLGFKQYSIKEKRTPLELRKLICLHLSLDSK